MEIVFWVAGIPKPQPRPRAFAVGGKARIYNPSEAEGWKGSIAAAAHSRLPDTPLTGPLSVSIAFYLPRPQRLMRKADPPGPIWHTKKPDRDNLDKAVLDCLTEIRMWEDDCQVCAGEIEKWYHAKDDRPGARIIIKELET